jgi:hypothetical protein
VIESRIDACAAFTVVEKRDAHRRASGPWESR